MATRFFQEKAHASRWHLEFLYLIYLPLQYKKVFKKKKKVEIKFARLLFLLKISTFCFFLRDRSSQCTCRAFCFEEQKLLPFKGENQHAGADCGCVAVNEMLDKLVILESCLNSQRSLR